MPDIVDFEVVFKRLHKLNTMLPPVDWRLSVLGLYTELGEVSEHIGKEDLGEVSELVKEFGDVIGTAVRVATYLPVQAYDFAKALYVAGGLEIDLQSRPVLTDPIATAYVELGRMVNSLPWRPWRVADQREVEWREALAALPFLARVIQAMYIAMILAGLDDADFKQAVNGHVQAKYDRVTNQIDGYAK